MTRCEQFYLDDLEDDLNITSLRMLVKDLLILFQACNEGVINVLGTSLMLQRGRVVARSSRYIDVMRRALF